MPVLAAWLLSVFTAVLNFLSTYLGKRVAVILAVVAAYAALFGAFYASIVGLVNGVVHAYPSTGVFLAGCFLPSNTYSCLTAIVTAHIARWVYDQKVLLVKTKLFIT